MTKSMGKKQKTPHFTPKSNHNKHHHGQPPAKRPRPAADGAKKKRIQASSPRVREIRLILESTATDDELASKIDHVKAELQAVDGALGEEGSSYLGIVDKGELAKRRQLLQKRHGLLKEERGLRQTLRAQLAEEERTGTERAEARAPSSPAPRNTEAAAAPQQTSPSSRTQTSVAPTSPPTAKRTFSYPPLSPPAAVGADASSIGDFLKRNTAAVGKKLAGAAAGRPEPK